jgi:hypothetical protein
MAIPRGYKRNSSGFLQPIGNVPSGATSGPGHGLAPIGEGRVYGPGEYRPKALRDAEAKIMASMEKAQGEHEKVMAGIAKAESNKFKRINDALNASKESDPKDKLGNTVPSKQTQYLEAQLMIILGQASQRGKRLTPEAAGVTPEQQKKFKEEGPYIPGVPGTSDLLQRKPPAQPKATEPDLSQPHRTPIEGTKMIHAMGEVTLTGKTRTGPNGKQEVEARMGDKVGWVPMENLQPIEAEGEGGMAQLRRFYNPPERDFQPF